MKPQSRQLGWRAVWWLTALLILVRSVPAQAPQIDWKKIEPPANWKAAAESWITTSRPEWERFQRSLASPEVRPQAPVILQATYSARLDGDRRLSGTMNWKLHHLDAQPGFLNLGNSSLAVSSIRSGEKAAIHGLNPSGEWQLWCAGDEDQLAGDWSQWGETRLSSRVFDLKLPRALASRIEIELPSRWEAHVSGLIPEVRALGSTGSRVWSFDLGRQLTVPLRIEPARSNGAPRILVRENTVYRLTTTDDLIRLRADLDCQVDGARDSELILGVPKPLRVFNVMLSNEIPIAFERDLGSEIDQVRIPLRALSPGQRVSIQVLAEARRSSEKAFPLPRIQQLNATLQEGTLQLEIDRPLEIRSIETQGLRQSLQTEESGKEFRSYQLLQTDCQLLVLVGEPLPVLSGDVRFLVNMQGESPRARARVRMSTREGELYSPQLRIPAGWDPISIEIADASETTPAAWHISPSGSGDQLIGLELRQPIRTDRDCTVIVDLKSTPPTAGEGPLRVPAPRIVGASDCYAHGVLWDQAPWELSETSPTSAELDNDAPDVELLLSLNWGEPPGAPAVPTGIRIADWSDGADPQFHRSGVTFSESEELPGVTTAQRPTTLRSAHVELSTTTTRIASSHTHQATFRLNQPVRPEELELSLPLAATPIRVTAKEVEIPFVRQDTKLLLRASPEPVSEFVLEYRTEAQSGWIVARDPMSFPQINCFVTEFVWHLSLDPQRRLYKLPLTAATTPREQPPIWKRLLGPLSRARGESLFNPLDRRDWQSLVNGTNRDEAAGRREDLWFVAPQIPGDFPIKTWNTTVADGLAWAAFLLLLALGIGLRRARTAWFSRSWIFLGGVFLVLAVFVGEPYAPIAGGGFLGSLLAILVPRRFAIGSDWLKDRTGSAGRVAALGSAAGALIVALGLVETGSSHSIGQDNTASTAVNYFEVPADGETPERIAFESSLRELWEAFQATAVRADWLLSRSQYQLDGSTAGPPVITAKFQLYQFGESPAPLKIPLEGVSLERVEGLLDGEPVRLIPASDGRGFVMPLTGDSLPTTGGKTPPPPPSARTQASIEPQLRTVELKFRPLPDSRAEQGLYSGMIPPLPESSIALPASWRVTLGAIPVPAMQSAPISIGPAQQIALAAQITELAPEENLTDVGMRTLVECGSLGARIQTGVLPKLVDPTRPAIVKLSLPPTLWVQSIRGSTVAHFEVDYSDPAAVSVTLALQPGKNATTLEPVEIISFLARSPEGFRMWPPYWASPKSVSSIPGADQSLIGVLAKPDLLIRAGDQSAEISSMSPQAFSDSLFSGIVWQVPDLAWSCRRGEGPVWTTSPMTATGRAQLQQTLTLDLPRSRWLLEGKIESNQGVPFEHTFIIDHRLEIQRASVLQDGAERLLRWTTTDDTDPNRRQLHLTIRDGQPGVQSVRIEGTWVTDVGDWAPLEATYLSGQTIDSSIAIKHTPRVTSTIQGEGATTRGDVDKDYLYRPGELSAPRSIRINPIQEVRQARAWIDLRPRDEKSWHVTIRAQLKDKLPASQPIRIQWETPGLSDLRPANRRENVRQLAKGKGLQWRPQSTSTRPAEMTLSAIWNTSEPASASLPLPTLSGVRWTEAWISMPKGAGHRPIRPVASVAGEAPTSWPATWTQVLNESRLDLYTSNLEPVAIEEFSDDSTARLLWAESLVWMDQGLTSTEPSLMGTTKYLLISERAVTLRVPESLQPDVRAISVNGEIQAGDQAVRLPARATDLSHEVIVWWEVPQSRAPISGDWLEFPETQKPAHRWAVVPPYHEYVLTAQANRSQIQTDYWLARTEAMLSATTEFRGAPWRVDGPLMHHLADSRSELSSIAELSPQNLERREKIESRWKQFISSGSHISSPIKEAPSVTPEIGLDAAIALCGDSRSLWLPASQETRVTGPTLLDRRWALGLTATLASLVSLGILMWFVKLFRRFQIPERIAARPNASLIGMGMIWWAGFSPSVLGLALALLGIFLWLRERWLRQAVQDSTLKLARASDFLSRSH